MMGLNIFLFFVIFSNFYGFNVGDLLDKVDDAIDNVGEAFNKGGEIFNKALEKSLEAIGNGCPVAPAQGCPQEITYWFYTRDNRDGVQLDLNNLGNAGFLDKPFKILVHGYQNDHNSLMITSLKDAYLDNDRYEYNVVVVDWGHFVKPGCYLNGWKSINSVAGCAADFIKNAIGEGNVGNVHLLGHSLGAHVSARISDHFDNPRIGRLTRFDPAMPLFVESLTDKGIADFRDTYHSNVDVLGQRSAQGDIDVYLNGDQFQPGCGCDLACSHMRSVLYYAESIKSGMQGFYCSFWDKFANDECRKPTEETLKEIGEYADKNERASFKVFGKQEPPFLYSRDDYLNENRFSEFKDLGQGECSSEIVGSVGGRLDQFLQSTEVSQYFLPA